MEEKPLSNDAKRIFVYDAEEYEFFCILNPPKRRYIKCFCEHTNSTKINEILSLVNQGLKKHQIEGKFCKEPSNLVN